MFSVAWVYELSIPENHLARFIADATEQLDLSKILKEYERRDGRGQAGYHP